jgi:diadenosine tetraphosphate (Ap4A) HIT family hydrolase/LmbE family N-acetylglucosaminyl deacetylase
MMAPSRLRYHPGARAVLLSPHFDDAILNCWSVLTSGSPVVVVNVFAGVPSAGVTGVWDQICGARDSPAQVQRRQAEDRDALGRVGIQPVNLSFLDAQYRPLGSVPPWQEIDDALAAQVPEASLVLAPAALGKANRDHVVVRDYTLHLFASGMPVQLYADVPYCVQHGWPAWVVAGPEGYGRDVDAFWAPSLGRVGRLAELRPSVTRLSESQAHAKLDALRTYRTQFPSIDAGGIALLRNPYVHGFEVGWTLAAHGVPRAQPPPGTRELRFLDGTAYRVDEDLCRGCFMNEHEHELPLTIRPVYDDGTFVVRQDAEWPVPGFYIVSTREHVGSIADLDETRFARFFVVLRAVRRAMQSQLGIARVQMYHEEKIARPHLHVWLLPLWPAVMHAHSINPRVYEGSIKDYIDLFSYADAERTIHDFNRIMTAALCADLQAGEESAGTSVT